MPGCDDTDRSCTFRFVELQKLFASEVGLNIHIQLIYIVEAVF